MSSDLRPVSQSEARQSLRPMTQKQFGAKTSAPGSPSGAFARRQARVTPRRDEDATRLSHVRRRAERSTDSRGVETPGERYALRSEGSKDPVDPVDPDQKM
jgi:hypothetical protein